MSKCCLCGFICVFLFLLFCIHFNLKKKKTFFLQYCKILNAIIATALLNYDATAMLVVVQYQH